MSYGSHCSTFKLEAVSTTPVAIIEPGNIACSVGSVVLLDASRSSYAGEATFTWRFLFRPIGSEVELYGFLDEDEEYRVTFRPDVIGIYRVGLTISTSNGTSDEIQTIVVASPSRVPHADDLYMKPPIWKFVPEDPWRGVDGVEVLETSWEAYAQVMAAHLLHAFEIDLRKSVMSILPSAPRMWQYYEPALDISNEDVSYYLTPGEAGVGAAAEGSTLEGFGYPVTDRRFRVHSSSPDPGMVGKTLEIPGFGTFKITRADEFDYFLAEPSIDYFTAPFEQTSGTGSVIRTRLTTGALPATVAVGDIAEIRSGPNEGRHRIEEIHAGYVLLDETLETWPTNDWYIYRLYSFAITDASMASATSSFVSIPEDGIANPVGTMLVVGGRAGIIQTEKTPSARTPAKRQGYVLSDDILLSGEYGLDWRHPHMIRIPGYDFEAAGVRNGDVLVFKALREDNGKWLNIASMVVGVENDTVGFELTTEYFEASEPVQVPNDAIIEICRTLGIDSVTESEDELAYGGEAQRIAEYVYDGTFPGDYRERWIPWEEVLQLSGVSLRMEAVKIIRNSTTPLPDDVQSIPAMSDHIRHVSVTKEADDLYLYRTESGKEVYKAREPVAVMENVDYVVDNEDGFKGKDLSAQAGVPIFQSDSADFVSRDIEPGCTITLLNTLQEFTITRVLSQNRVLMATAPSVPINFGEYQLKRKKVGRFLRFRPGLFSPTLPAPDRLWAEVTYVDNEGVIEEVYGKRFNFTRDDLSASAVGLDYTACIRGLAYSFMKGVKPATLELAAHIILGMPFTQWRSLVVELRDDYVMDASTSQSKYGRIVVAYVNDDGVTTGKTAAYLYPTGSADSPEDMAGLAYHHTETDRKIRVGDVLPAYYPLSCGVRVSDRFHGDTKWWRTWALQYGAEWELYKYHNFQIEVNVDVVDVWNLDILATFTHEDFRKEHVDVIGPVGVKYIEDEVEITDDLHLDIEFHFDDNPYGSFEAVMKQGSYSFLSTPLLHYGSRPLMTRSLVTCTCAVIEVAGTIDVVRIEDGGLLGATNPPTSTHMHDSPMMRARSAYGEGDLLRIHQGDLEGFYEISEVISDTDARVVQVTGDPLPILPAVPFPTTAADLTCSIYRRMENPISWGNVTGTGGSTSVEVDTTLYSDGVTSEDLLIITEGSSRGTYRIASVTTPAGFALDLTTQWTELELAKAIPADTDDPGIIIRPRLYREDAFSGQAVLNANQLQWLVTLGDPLYLGIITPRHDRLEIVDGSGTVLHSAKIVHIEAPDTIYTEEIPVAYVGGQSIQIKRGRFNSGSSWDELIEEAPVDDLTIEATFNNGVLNFSTAPGDREVQLWGTYDGDATDIGLHAGEVYILPGDYFHVVSGADQSIDVGYGEGIFPICKVEAAKLTLATEMTGLTTAATIIRGDLL
jgi:hypothetical protein